MYVSLAQERKFHSTPSLRKYTAEFDAASKGASLPERVGTPKSKHKRRTKKTRHTNLTGLLAHTRSVHR